MVYPTLLANYVDFIATNPKGLLMATPQGFNFIKISIKISLNEANKKYSCITFFIIFLKSIVDWFHQFGIHFNFTFVVGHDMS